MLNEKERRAVVCVKENRVCEAILRFNEAEKAYAEDKNYCGVARVSAKLAALTEHLGNLESANIHYVHAVEAAGLTNDALFLAKILEAQGAFFLRQKNLDGFLCVTDQLLSLLDEKLVLSEGPSLKERIRLYWENRGEELEHES